MRYSFFISLCALVVMSCQPKYHVPEVIELHDNWQFKITSDILWHGAEVPGNVHSDLLNHKLIDDPFVGDNEQHLQWISESDWDYKTSFTLAEETLEKNYIELHFEGLDTYASVYLNDSLILKVNNAFRQWNVDVKPLLKSENTLKILFESTSKFEAVEKSKLPYELPEGNRIFTRKAQFQFGWDWGPKLNTSGIWRAVTLKAWDDFKINDVYVHQQQLNDSIATFMVDMDVDKGTNLELTYDIYVNGKLNTTYVGEDKSKMGFQIKNPKRWWPHNLGEPHLYDIKIIAKEGRRILDSIAIKKGLRTVELVTEKDSLGETFYFKVNGVPVYAKGANYIPQHSLQNKVSETNYENLLDDVVEANMNMLRVWGGGIYENDIFYELCDEKGIMVWQDFMFACAMYPGDQNFLNNVKAEAVDNIKRLRDHPSIMLWCGNNENSEGWHRWGWQANRSDAEKTEIWNNYLNVFDSILPRTVESLTNVPYWESSPKYGRGNPNYEFEGDAHDWWVWHDAYPFEHFEDHVPRFMSEFGFQSFPSYEAIRYINQSDSIDIDSDGFKNHQKHSRGFELIEEYMSRDFPVPSAPEDYVYMSQLVQAYGITKGIEAHRRAKPYNMGTLYWQLNDCWPAVSWSSLDVFGNWKALHYKAKQSFEDILISSVIQNDTLKTYIVNDDLQSYRGDLDILILDVSGQILWRDSIVVEVEKGSGKLYHELDLTELSVDRSKVVVFTKYLDKTKLRYLVKPKDLKLTQEDINYSVSKTADGFQVELSSETLQKDVFLYTKTKGHFSNNFFDLLPNQSKTIFFVTDSKNMDSDLSLKLKTFNNFIR
ncbi:MAG: glycoside hydrolase family 2 protein [Bacteroidota bacterium]